MLAAILIETLYKLSHMKKLAFLVIMIFTSIIAFSQDYSNLESIVLDDSIQCKIAEVKVIECSKFLLTKPCIEDLNSLHACQFLIKWMGQTPNYEFGFDNTVYKSIKSNMMLMGRYLACQCTVAINDRPKSFDKAFQVKYITSFLEYCEDSKNGVKITSKLTKLIEAKNNGSLSEEL
jgi:hypothetical protein